MSFLDGLLTMLGSIESDAISVHKERCISVRNRNARCMRCVEACTSGALAYEQGALAVHPERCIGCGTCATACPTCAIEICDPTDEELTARVKRSIAATKGHPVVACSKAAARVRAELDGAPSGARLFGRSGRNRLCVDEARMVEVPCLGRVDESVLVGMAAYRSYDVTLVCGQCDTCEHAPGGSLVREVLQGSRNLLDAFGSDMPVRLGQDMPPHVIDKAAEVEARLSASGGKAGGGVSRRDFLRGAKDSAATAAVEAATSAVAEGLGAAAPASQAGAFQKVGKDGSLSHFVPSRRTRLYNYLRHVGDGTPVAETVATRIIGSVSINADACSSCRMCAVFCPTGALKKVDEKGSFGIVHRPSACVQCRLCEGICPQHAITVSGNVPIRQFLGKEAVRYGMKEPEWVPNKPTSMYDKVHSVLGPDLEMCMF